MVTNVRMRGMRLLLPLFAALLVASGALPGAIAAETLDDWKAGPIASGSATYAGNVDEPVASATLYTGTGFTVRGWVVDKTAQGWTGIVEVHVYDGLPSEGGVFLGSAVIQQSRPDVSSAFGYGYWEPSGYALAVPAGKIRAGTRSLTVLARTADKGWWYRQVSVNVQDRASYSNQPLIVMERPESAERIKTDADYTIYGYALDRNATSGVGVDRVQVYFDWPKTDSRTTLVGEATLGQDSATATAAYGSQFGKAGWRLTFSPTKFRADTHQMFVYARSSVTGTETMMDRQITIYD